MSPEISHNGSQRFKSALTLVLLAPIISELLSGATRLSTIFAIVPEAMVWGCGALLVREVARRRGLGWPSLLLMGFALAIAEEVLIQQTSVAPLPWVGPGSTYDRAWGVNWLYFLFMLGYESVWVVLVPVHLTEQLFPRRRSEAWLRLPGIISCSVLFLLGSLMAWFAWTKVVRPKVFHVPDYTVPPLTMALGGLAIVMLVAGALKAVPRREASCSWRPPRPAFLALDTFLIGLPWYGIIALDFGAFVGIRATPFWIPLLIGTAWGSGACVLIQRWTSSTFWSDQHRFALIFGAVWVPIIGGFGGSNSWPLADLIGKIGIDVVAICLLIVLGRRLRTRESKPDFQTRHDQIR